MLAEFFESFRAFVGSFTTEQWVMLGIGFLALSCAFRVAKRLVSTILTIIAVLAILYFFVPELYTTVIGWANSGISYLAGLFAGANDFPLPAL